MFYKTNTALVRLQTHKYLYQPLAMVKRRNEDAQARREEVEARDAREDDVSADSFSKGFERASDDVMKHRRIVKAKEGKRPAASSTANPFSGFSGLTQSSSTSAEGSKNPFTGFTGLTSSKPTNGTETSTPAPTTASTASTASSGNSYEKAMEVLNKDFLGFATRQMKEHPSGSWIEAAQEYLKYADEISKKHASSKPVSTQSASSFSYSSASRTKSKPAEPAQSKSTSSSIFGSESKTQETKSSVPAFSFGGASATTNLAEKKTEEPKSSTPAFSFGGAAATSVPEKKSEEPKSSVPAFSFGGASTTTSTSEKSSGFSFGNNTSTTQSAGFSFGNKDTSTTASSGFSFNNSNASGGLSFGKPAATSASTSATEEKKEEEDEETVGQEPPTVILKSEESSDDETKFQVEKAKLHEFKKDEKRWADKGVHPLQVLKNKTTGKYRVLMRNQIGKVVLNAAVYSGMTVTPQEAKGKTNGAMVSLPVGEDGSTLTQFLIKVNPTSASDFIQALKDAASAS